MKNIIYLLLPMVLFSLAACSSNENNNLNGEETAYISQETSEAANTTEAEALAAPTDETPPEETEEAEQITDGEKTNILIAYFSWSGNTRAMANLINDHVGGDLFEIATVNGYSSDYNTCLDEAMAEQSANARPELTASVQNIEAYDAIFIGYPNWWGDMPMAVYTFLEEYDLSGKNVIPFCTHGGSGFSNTQSSIRNEAPDANVLEGLAVHGSNINSAGEEIQNWLADIGFRD